jgi:molybdate transport system regulatory protein
MKAGNDFMQQRLYCVLSARIAKDDIFFGPGPCKLMFLIQETGSLEAAARAMNMSYSKARKIILRLEKEIGKSMVSRHPGGPHGGASYLTENGAHFLAAYEEFHKQLLQAASPLFESCFADYLDGSH